MSRGRLFAMIAVALPVAGALASVVANEAALAGATEWRIPVTGYDPRDPLRGRYVQFSYAWRASGDAGLCGGANACRLCLEDGGARVRVVREGVACAAAIDPEASGLRVWRSADTGDGRITAATRLWVSEAGAPALERQLRSRPMVAVARLTSGGRLAPVRLEPAGAAPR